MKSKTTEPDTFPEPSSVGLDHFGTLKTSFRMANLFEAISGFQGEAPTIKRDSGGQIGRRTYSYASLTSVVDSIRPILAKHNLGYIQSVSPVGNHLVCTTRIVHASGEWVESEACVPHDGSNAERGGDGNQQMGVGSTYARRYGISAALGLVVEDDSDGAGGGNGGGKKTASSSSAPAGDRNKPTQKQVGMFKAKQIDLEEKMGDRDSAAEWIREQYRAHDFPAVEPSKLERKQLSALIDLMVAELERLGGES